MIQFEYDDASVLFFKVFNEKAAAWSATLKEVTRTTLRARALPVHSFPLLPFFFFLALAPPYANGADPTVFC